MQSNKLSQWLEVIVRQKLDDDASGHDFYHVQRVAKLCYYFSVKEKADVSICIAAGYLHDYCRPDERITGHAHDSEIALQRIRAVLTPCPYLTELQKKAVIQCIAEHEQYQHLGGPIPESLESRILQDADRLDAMGAIGIARTFMFTGAVNGIMYLPDEGHENAQVLTAVAHFYNMLLRLPDSMHTNEAKKLGEVYKKQMLSFLDSFYQQWELPDQLLHTLQSQEI